MPGPSPVQDPRWYQPLRRLFAQQGYAQLQLIDDLMPSVDLLNLPVELLWSQGWYRAFCVGNQAALGAGIYAVVGLRNASTDKVLVLEGITGITAAASNNWEWMADPGGGLSLTCVSLDSREPGGVLQSRVIMATTVALPLSQNMLFLPSSGWMDFEAVLFPGSAFFLRHNTANVACSLGFRWRERTFTQQEVQR